MCSEQTIDCNSINKDWDCSIINCKNTLAPLLEDLILRIIHGSCGHFPREVLDPAASVLNLILKGMPTADAERVVKYASGQEFFRLGNEGAQIFISILGKCAQSLTNVSLMMDIVEDVWTIHQTYSNTETIGGGDCVNKFVGKYKRRI